MLLEASSHIGSVADSRVVHPEIVADCPHDHWSRIDSNSHRQSSAPGPSSCFLAQDLLYAERGQHRPPSMILVGDGRERDTSHRQRTG